MNSSCFENSKGRPTKNQITYEKCFIIIENMIQGKKLTEISKIDGFPAVKILYSWTKRNHFLRRLIRNVQSMKHEYLFELQLEKKISFTKLR